MIITIGGKSGTGKSSVGNLLGEKLGYRFVSIGQIRRKMAKDMGISISELNKIGEKEDFTDRDADKILEELGREEDNIIIDSRTAYHFVPNSVKIYLKADLDERARRVFNHIRMSEKYHNQDGVADALEEKDSSDLRRFKRLYGIDPSEEEQYDLVIDATKISVEQVVEKILDFLKKKNDK